MAQHVIDVDGVPTLFSPVPAHSLEPGDRFSLASIRFAVQPTRLVLSRICLAMPTADDLHVWADHLPPTDHPARDAMAVFTRSHPHDSAGRVCRYPSNLVVLRAVGARPGRGGAR